MIRRLRIKFVCINMTLVMVILVLILSLLYHSTRMGLEDISLQAMQNAVMQNSLAIRPGAPGRDSGQPCFILREGPWGGLIASGDSYYDLSDTEQLQNIYLAAVDSGERSAVLKDYSLRFLRMESLLGDSFVFTDISSELQTLSEMARTCFLIGLAAFCVFLIISILLARWAVRPVEKAWQQQRQFVADASHELKTPLTVILTNAELLQDPRYDSADQGRLAENILSMSRQMRGLVESLLQLARVDNGQTKEERQTVELSRLVENSLLPFEPLYFEQGLELRSDIEPGITLTGSPQHLIQVLDILLDNAQKYSAPGSIVELSLQRQGHGKCLLRLYSPGQPMREEVCRDIFKRFYRVDEARKLSGSYGLGLSIAQEIVRNHRGKIWAEPAENGNLFCITLPL